MYLEVVRRDLKFFAWKVLIVVLVFRAIGANAQTSIPVVTGDQRVDKLLSQMTLAEKLTLIHGAQEDPSQYQGQAGYLAGIPRLGVPGMRFADGPPGVLTRHPSQAPVATMGLAATFSVKDAEAAGVVVGHQDRALGVSVSLQPFVNIDRDITFQRGYNTLGEDPFLTSQIGVGQIRGIQSQHVMAQIKHYIGYDTNGANNFIDQQTLHEVYLAPFAAAIGAGVSSVMCSYNRINGGFACGNKDVLTKILRDELGFKSFVTADWGATHGVKDINAGLDMEMPGPPGKHDQFAIPSFFDSEPPAPPRSHAAAIRALYGTNLPEEPTFAMVLRSGGGGGDLGLKLDSEKMPEALKDGTVTEERITQAAGRVLYEMVRFGYLDGLSKLSVTPEPVEEDGKAIEKTAEDSAVLLKNEGNTLPLKVAELDRTVLIGPGAAQVFAIGLSGERSVGLPEREVGPYDAIKKISGNSKIGLAINDDMTGRIIPASLLSHDGKPGLERIVSGQSVQVDPEVDFTTHGKNALPPNSKITWKGTLTVDKPGNYWLYLQALGANASYSIDGNQVGHTGALQGAIHGDILQAAQDNAVPTPDGLDNVRRDVDLTAGPHSIEVSITPDTSDAPAQVRLNWYTPDQRVADHAAAIDAARKARIAVVFLWTRRTPIFGLPGEQNKLVEEVAAVNPNTVVVLNVSQPVATPWLDKVKSVLLMGWPGDEGGWATANVLLGKVSPAGRLPVTWAKRLEDYAPNDPKYPERSGHAADGKTIFSEGVDVGYRWFDRENIVPQFPFGFGLSYSTFAYSNLAVSKAADKGLDVNVTIRNVGSVASDEVPQIYLGAPDTIPDGVRFPVRSLVAFDRVGFAPGESRVVKLQVAPRQLEYWSAADERWVTATGKRTLSVGASSRDLRLSTTIDQ